VSVHCGWLKSHAGGGMHPPSPSAIGQDKSRTYSLPGEFRDDVNSLLESGDYFVTKSAVGDF